MATMVAEPYVNHIPTMTGGVGQQALRKFYLENFIFSNPPDTALVPISRTVGPTQVVDEMLFTFTHTTEVPWMLPGVAPTGRRVEIPLLAVVKFRGNKLYHEHIYWDQASVLVQVGLLLDSDTQQQQQQEQLAVNSNNNSTDNTTSSINSHYSSQNTNDTPPTTTTTTTVSWMDTVLEIDLLLVMLNLTMRADAESRVQALFHLATLSDSCTQSSGGSSSDSTAMHSTTTEENGVNTNTDNTSTTSTPTATVISRGK